MKGHTFPQTLTGRGLGIDAGNDQPPLLWLFQGEGLREAPSPTVGRLQAKNFHKMFTTGALFHTKTFEKLHIAEI